MKHALVLRMPQAAFYQKRRRAQLSGVPESVIRRELGRGIRRHVGAITRTEIRDTSGRRVRPQKDWREATTDGKGVKGCFLLNSGQTYAVIEHWPPGTVKRYRVSVTDEGIEKHA